MRYSRSHDWDGSFSGWHGPGDMMLDPDISPWCGRTYDACVDAISVNWWAPGILWNLALDFANLIVPYAVFHFLVMLFIGGQGIFGRSVYGLPGFGYWAFLRGSTAGGGLGFRIFALFALPYLLYALLAFSMNFLNWTVRGPLSVGLHAMLPEWAHQLLLTLTGYPVGWGSLARLWT